MIPLIHFRLRDAVSTMSGDQLDDAGEIDCLEIVELAKVRLEKAAEKIATIRGHAESVHSILEELEQNIDE